MKIQLFTDMSKSDDEVRLIFYGDKKDGKFPPGDSENWSLSKVRRAISKNDHSKLIKPISYRPMDNRYIYYDPQVIHRPILSIMPHLSRENIAFISGRTNKHRDSSHFFVSNKLVEYKCGESNACGRVYPLYLYGKDGTGPKKNTNLNNDIVRKISEIIGLKYDVTLSDSDHFSSFDVLSYIYARLYSPSYRKKNSQYINDDFARVPYPNDRGEFTSYASIGTRLITLHTSDINYNIEGYPLSEGNNIVDSYKYKDGSIFINKTQFFKDVPEEVWNYSIGGYQPVQLWLKNHKKIKLSLENTMWYRTMLDVIKQTIEVMREIDSL